MVTDRYLGVEDRLGKKDTYLCTFSAYGVNHANGVKLTCLEKLTVDKKVVVDHVWVESEDLVKAKLRTGQRLIIEGKLTKRLRPPVNLFDPPVLDIQLNNKLIILKVLKRPKR